MLKLISEMKKKITKIKNNSAHAVSFCAASKSSPASFIHLPILVWNW